MPAVSLLRRTSLALFLAASGAFALAQEKPAEPYIYVPTEFQEGKDVVWVPTPQVLVDRMLDMAKVTKDDFVMDLGSGDGRTVITAARRGATAVGIEYNPDMVELSKRNAEKEGVSAKATFVKADLFETDFSRADVITMFLLPRINMTLRPKILELKPGTRIASNTFDMGDWQADETVVLKEADGCKTTYCTALFWIVPAKVGGTYKTPHGELILRQQFQMLTGTLKSGGRNLPVAGRVRGEDISFTVEGRAYRARLNGGNLELR